MFDFFRSQRKAVKWFLSGLLGLVALSLVITLVPSVFTGQQPNLNDPVLVDVGNDAVTTLDVRYALADYARAGTPPDAMAYMARQSIDNIIEEKVLLQEAERLGVKPSEKDLALWIRDQMPRLFEGGTFNSQQYKMFIQQQFQMSVPRFEQNLLKDLTIETRLRQLVTDNIVVSDDEVRERFQDRNEKAKIEYAVIEVEDFRSRVQPSEEDLQAYFQDNKFRYTIPEKRDVYVFEVDPDAIPEAEFTDAEIRNFYEQNRYRFETQERVLASHILFMTMDPDSGEEKPEEEISAIEEEAREVLEQIRSGGDFAELAKERSDDPGSAEKGGDLGWVVRGQMVPQFEEATFSMAPGEVSDLVKTEYGYHIIQVHKKDQPQLQPLEEAREQIIADLQAEREQTARFELLDNAIQAVGQASDDFERIAEENRLQLSVYEGISGQQPPPDLAETPRFIGQIFAAQAGEAVTHAVDDKTYIAKIADITLGRQAEFDEAAERIREDYVNAEARRLAQTRAQELLDQAKEAGDLGRAASRLGVDVETSDFFTRSDAVEGFTGAQTIGNPAFDAEIGSIHGPINAGERIGVYEVAGHEDADMTLFPEQRTELRQELLEGRQNEVFNLFKALARQRYQQEGKIERYEERIDQFIRQFQQG